MLDADGEPLVDVTVAAMRIETRDWSDRRLVPVGHLGITDDRGAYRIYGLEPGQYDVAATLRASAVSPPDVPAAVAGAQDQYGFAPTFYPGTPDIAEAERVALRAADDTSQVDIVFRAARFARVSGRVLSSSGQVAFGTIVSLQRSRSAGLGLLHGFSGVARIKSDGAFTITGIPAGSYVLRAMWVPASVAGQVARTGRPDALVAARAGEFASLPLTVTGTDVVGLSLATLPAGRLHGRVIHDGSPLAWRPDSLTVSAYAGGPEDFAAGPTTGLRVSSDGTFDIGAVTGTFFVRLAQLPKGVAVARVSSGGRDATDTGVSIRSREEVDIDVVLTSTTSRCVGTVHDDQGRTVSGATVLVFADDAERWVLPASRYVAVTSVDGFGAFTIEGLPAGEYVAKAFAPGTDIQWRDPDYLRLKAADGVHVSLRDGSDMSVDLRLSRD